MNQTVSLDEALDVIEKLPRENWQTLIDIVNKRDHELRREQIAQNILESRAEYQRGELKPMNVEEAMKALNKCN
jgi:hypothetical protein